MILDCDIIYLFYDFFFIIFERGEFLFMCFVWNIRLILICMNSGVDIIRMVFKLY